MKKIYIQYPEGVDQYMVKNLTSLLALFALITSTDVTSNPISHIEVLKLSFFPGRKCQNFRNAKI